MPRRVMQGSTEWSAEEIIKLRELAADQTHIKIAEQLLKRTDRAIRRKAAELGLLVGTRVARRSESPSA